VSTEDPDVHGELSPKSERQGKRRLGGMLFASAAGLALYALGPNP
jgi:hypothetical protein